ncbi:hypothetical protein [Clostridium sp. BSD9I1]|uniref:hypothetical protein n=1 Tax=Clostridium sp. BSD9I1 TaxID=2003589 RepID=UPI001645D4B6|nr:hypothetical protein [Clostridium sp. BSD9I1]
MWDNIKKCMYIVFIIWTVMVLFIVYKNIEFPFILQFVVGYVICLLLVGLYFIVTAFLNIRKSKWSTIKKVFIKFIIGSFTLWFLNILFIYLIKGELRITDRIVNSIILSFVFTFGELGVEKNSD